jgi:hypothetical protein
MHFWEMQLLEFLLRKQIVTVGTVPLHVAAGLGSEAFTCRGGAHTIRLSFVWVEAGMF